MSGFHEGTIGGHRLVLPVGTKSLLFGAHGVLWHPTLVFVAWWKLYGFPRDPRLWLAFVIHDWGYWGCPNMDGPEGEVHPLLAARLMKRWFGPGWGQFCACHSRHWSRIVGLSPSRLCWADKWAAVMLPPWMYVPSALASGELHEYMADAARRETLHGERNVQFAQTPIAWYRDVQRFLRREVEEAILKR